jgi:hypothetical protein
MSIRTTITICNVSQSSVVIEDIMNALRDFIDSRLYPNGSSDEEHDNALHNLQQRATAFVLLSFMDGMEVMSDVFAMPRVSYNAAVEVKVNDQLLPDQYLDVFLAAINEELVSLEECKTLISAGDTKVLKEENEHIERLLGALRELGVTVGDDYLQKLMGRTNEERQ